MTHELDPASLVDGRVTDTKLEELLAVQTELSTLDYKTLIDLAAKPSLLEFVKDVGAMSAAGGYIVAGVDGHGVPTGDMDDCSEADFDESRLSPRLARYLPDGIRITPRVIRREEHVVVLIFIAAHPKGYAIFRADGQFEDSAGEMKNIFRQGEAYWRDGTRSVRISQAGMELVIERRIQTAKALWIEEHKELDARQLEDWRGSQAARAPLAAQSIDIPAHELQIATLEMVRAGDDIALKHVMLDAEHRARELIEAEDDAGVDGVVDQLAAVGAIMQQYEQYPAVERVVRSLSQIYTIPLEKVDDLLVFGYPSKIDPKLIGPRIFLRVILRVYALGALAVRLRHWDVVRLLTLQLPDRVNDYYNSWLRHALTVAARAELLRTSVAGQIRDTSLLSMAAATVAREPALTADGVDDDRVLSSLAQFDFLSNLIAMDDADSVDSHYFYTNWARFRQERVQPLANSVIADPKLRSAIFGDRTDQWVATALNALDLMAKGEGFRYDGFNGWERTPVGSYVRSFLPENAG